MKQRIDFIVGGIQKCGTTTLWKLLRQHPSLAASPLKEPHFFYRDVPFDRRLNEVDIDRHHRNWLKKNGHFESEKLYFEASSELCFLEPTRAGNLFDPLPRVKRYNPHIKIIVLLRDPVERFFSQWSMLRRRGAEGKSWGTELSFQAHFDQAMEKWRATGFQRHLYGGCYGSIALRLMKLFDRKALLFLNPVDVNDCLREVEQFLNIPSFDYQPVGTSPARYSRDQLPYACANELRTFYKPEVESFSCLSGLDISRWFDGNI